MTTTAPWNLLRDTCTPIYEFPVREEGSLKGREGKKGEREEEKRKNQDLGWRKMAVPMQTTRRAPRTSSGHWTGKWRHLRLWSSRAKVHAIADRRPTTDNRRRRRRRVAAELSLQLRKIATPPVTVVFQPFRTAYLPRQLERTRRTHHVRARNSPRFRSINLMFRGNY